MDKLTPRERARLHELHEPRTKLRVAFDCAVTSLSMVPGYNLSVWSGRDEQMVHNTQGTRDLHGPSALEAIDAALTDLHQVRDEIASYLATRNGEVAAQLDEDTRRAAAADAEFKAKYLTGKRDEPC
jgi:hypothetical protein